MPPSECVIAMAQALQQLSHRVERIRGNAQGQAALRQVAAALIALQGNVARTASSETVARLPEDVRSLAGRVDDAAHRIGARVTAAIEARPAIFAETFARHRRGRSGGPELATLLRTLIDRIERNGLARYDDSTLERLERSIAKLAAKLDADDSRLLDAPEPESIKPRVEHQDISYVASPATVPTTIDALARDVSDLRQAEKRTQDSLEAVHGTMEDVIHRLAMIEADMRARPMQPTPAAPVMAATAAPDAAAVTSPAAPPEETAAPVPQRTAAAAPQACTPGSPSPEVPLSVHDSVYPESAEDLQNCPPQPPRERGSGVPSGGSSGSDASPGAILSCLTSDSASKSDFIAAARRAVQAASRRGLEAHTVAPTSAGARRGATLVRMGMLAALAGALAVVLALVAGLQIADGLRTGPMGARIDAPSTAAAAAGLTAEGAAALAGQAPLADRTGGLHAPDGTTGATTGIVIFGATSEPPPQAQILLPPPVGR